MQTPAPSIEGYDILEKLGEAGQGQVWRAVQLSMRRQVALKVPRLGLLSAKKALARFEREVFLAARLNHPHIARIVDSGVHQGLYYYVMDLIEGKHLDQYVKDNALSQRQILELMKVICEAVEYAHEHGVIHRDLKPSNILVTKDGHPFILDFGLAKSVLAQDLTMTVSMDGEPAGTPAYMSPEQAAGHSDRIDARTDVYSLGTITFMLLTDQYPHDLSGSHADVLRRISTEEVVRPRQFNPKIDRALESLLLRALERDPSRRYPSVAAFARDMDKYLNGERFGLPRCSYVRWLPRSVRGYQRAAAGILTIALLMVGGLEIGRRARSNRTPAFPGPDGSLAARSGPLLTIPGDVNLIVNGGFETGTAVPWMVQSGGGATVTATVVNECAGARIPEEPIEGDYCLHVKVSGPSANTWDCQFAAYAPTFVKGRKYTFSACLKTRGGAGQINMKAEHSGGDFHAYAEQQFTITDQWVEYHVTTGVMAADVSATALVFQVGFQEQEFWVDNVKFYEGDYIRPDGADSPRTTLYQPNLIANGGFETGAITTPWIVDGGGGATVTATVVNDCTGAGVREDPFEGAYCLHVKVSGPSTNFWDCQFFARAWPFTKGKKYTLSACFKSKQGTGRICMAPQRTGANPQNYNAQEVTITARWVEYHVTTAVMASDVSPTALVFQVGFQEQEFWVDNVKFYEGDYIPSR